ncbi:MAG: dihydroorotase [Planctomycetota bacterium]|nr:dihydroorotase [Planctomycetota bacterium]
MSSGAILFRGGRILDAAQSIDAEGDVLVVDGRVAKVAPGRTIDAPEGARVVACGGMLVTPGLIDPHVHLREPGGEAKETVKSGTASAVAGGFATVCCMPNTNPAIDTATTVRFVQQAAREAAKARVFVVGAATVGRKGEQLASMHSMASAGAVAFSDDGECIMNPAMMRRVLEVCASLGKAFMQHCQDHHLSEGGVMNEGAVATRLGLLPWPREAEEIIVERDVRLNKAIGAHYHAQHLSSGGSAAILRRARAEGIRCSGEASPHHLLLTDEACEGYDTQAKMNPPLRTKRDLAELKAAIADGTIDVLATDHAPHTVAEKARDFASAPFGIIGLDCALALYAKALVEDGVIGWPRMIELMTRTPAELCGLDALGLGTLREGAPGDVTVIDPMLEWTIDANAFASKSRNCPFHGWKVRGRATMTVVGGRVLFELPPAGSQPVSRPAAAAVGS